MGDSRGAPDLRPGRFSWRWVLALVLWWLLWSGLMISGQKLHRSEFFLVAAGGTFALALVAGSRRWAQRLLRWPQFDPMVLEPIRTFLLCVLAMGLVAGPFLQNEIVFDATFAIGIPTMILLTARAWRHRKIWNAQQQFLKYCGSRVGHGVSAEEVLESLEWVVEILDGEIALTNPLQKVEDHLATVRVRLVRAGQDLGETASQLSALGVVTCEGDLLAMPLGDLVCRVAQRRHKDQGTPIERTDAPREE